MTTMSEELAVLDSKVDQLETSTSALSKKVDDIERPKKLFERLTLGTAGLLIFLFAASGVIEKITDSSLFLKGLHWVLGTDRAVLSHLRNVEAAGEKEINDLKTAVAHVARKQIKVTGMHFRLLKLGISNSDAYLKCLLDKSTDPALQASEVAIANACQSVDAIVKKSDVDYFGTNLGSDVSIIFAIELTEVSPDFSKTPLKLVSDILSINKEVADEDDSKLALAVYLDKYVNLKIDGKKIFLANNFQLFNGQKTMVVEGSNYSFRIFKAKHYQIKGENDVTWPFRELEATLADDAPKGLKVSIAAMIFPNLSVTRAEK